MFYARSGFNNGIPSGFAETGGFTNYANQSGKMSGLDKIQRFIRIAELNREMSLSDISSVGAEMNL